MEGLDQRLLRLQTSLAQKRLAPDAQARAAPEMSYGRHGMPPFPDTRRAAVLILLCPGETDWFLPLTVRPATMSAHAGQVSFPGGELEPGEGIEKAAFREFEEELGARTDRFVLLGRLTPLLVYASNYLVTPCVAAADIRPVFSPSPAEVDEVVEAPIGVLLESSNRGQHWIQRRGVRFRTPHMRSGEHRIWGATCMILTEFLEIWNSCE